MNKKREAYPKLIYEEIGLPYDDGTFSFETLQGLQDFLVELKVLGYYVPDITFDMIQEEIENE